MKTFTKEERLSGKIFIDALIQNGKSISSFPFRIVWLEVPEGKAKARIVISVPKRLFKRAVDRNRMKRLIREGYRKNKTVLYENIENKTIHLLVVYTSKTMLEANEMEEKMVSTIHLLVKKMNTAKK